MLRWLSPLPTPWQRWKDAGVLAVTNRNEWNTADTAIVAAAEFIRAFAACATDEERAGVQTKWPTISQAKAIFDCESLNKWELEAWLMAGLTDRGAARRCGLRPAVVGVYEHLFFAMREFLYQREALAEKLFGAFVFIKFADEELGRFWHYLGLTAPRAVLRRFITAYRAAWEPGTPQLLSSYLKPDAPVSLSMQAFVAINLLPDNTKPAAIFFESHLGLIEAERETDPARKKERVNQIKQTMVEFTRGYLAGKTAEELLRLLRYLPSLEGVTAKMRALVAGGHIAPLLAAQGVKNLPAELCELPDLVGLSPARESGALEGA